MKTKKGFTLLELLAVIAILAIIVLLTLPNVLKIFNEAKKGSFVAETQEIAKTSTTKFIQESLKGNKVNEISNDGAYKLDLNNKDLKYYIKLNSKGKITYLEVSNDTYYVQEGNGVSVIDYINISSDNVKEGSPLERTLEDENINLGVLFFNNEESNQFLGTDETIYTLADIMLKAEEMELVYKYSTVNSNDLSLPSGNSFTEPTLVRYSFICKNQDQKPGSGTSHLVTPYCLNYEILLTDVHENTSGWVNNNKTTFTTSGGDYEEIYFWITSSFIKNNERVEGNVRAAKFAQVDISAFGQYYSMHYDTISYSNFIIVLEALGIDKNSYLGPCAGRKC